MTVPFAVAVMVFASPTVELKVPVVTPLLFVGAGCVMVFPLPVAERTTVAPLIARLLLSFTVTVIVAVPLPAAMVVGEAVTVDREAETAADVTLTLTVCESAMPLAVAETVLVAATVELKVPVATPLASVGPTG